jgi:4-hydroxy-tetrahydrodipicolinate synthase
MITPLHQSLAGNLHGTWTALITPFANDALDLPTFRRLIEYQIANGVSGLVVCGSTGETPTLTDNEFRAMIDNAVTAVARRVPVFAGTGTNATSTTIERTRIAYECGADGALVVAPPYNKPTQAGIIAHMEAVALATPLPVLLYNVPGRSVTDIQAETVVRLSRVPGIVGVKEASGDVDRASYIARHAVPGFALFSGDDSLTLPIISVGGCGVVSVASNIVPATVSRLTTAALRGDMDEARAIHLGLGELYHALFVETNPIPLKAAAAMLGFGTGDVRLPLTPATPATVEILQRTLRDVGETASAFGQSDREMSVGV